MASPAPARARRTMPRGTPPARGAAARKAAAPVRVPPADRRHLQVVTDARVVAQRRRRRLRGLVILTGVVMMASLFSLAAFHAMLAKAQADLDTVEQRVSDAQARY